MNKEQKHTNNSVRKEQIVDFKKRQRRGNYFCCKLFLANVPLMVSILNNLLIMDSLISIMKDFVSRFFTMLSFCAPWNYPSNLWFPDVFREYERGTLKRNKSSFLTHFRPVLLISIPCERHKTLGFLLFLGGIKSEHWEEMGEIIRYLQNLKTFFSRSNFH